jgi:hypothetical protein
MNALTKNPALLRDFFYGEFSTMQGEDREMIKIGLQF